jgi:hypothetical protein
MIFYILFRRNSVLKGLKPVIKSSEYVMVTAHVIVILACTNTCHGIAFWDA